MRTIYLVRHGESNANAGERTESEAQIKLTALGEAQAELACQTLSRLGVKKIVASKYPRALQTAKPLADKLGLPIEVWPIHEFFYLDPKVANGTTQEERKLIRDKFWGTMATDWRHAPDTESFNDFLGRIESCKARILESTDTICIFGHGLFYTALLITLHNPEANAAEIMRLTHQTIYTTFCNVKNGEILKLTHSNAKWLEFPPIPGR